MCVRTCACVCVWSQPCCVGRPVLWSGLLYKTVLCKPILSKLYCGTLVWGYRVNMAAKVYSAMCV